MKKKCKTEEGNEKVGKKHNKVLKKCKRDKKVESS